MIEILFYSSSDDDQVVSSSGQTSATLVVPTKFTSAYVLFVDYQTKGTEDSLSIIAAFKPVGNDDFYYETKPGVNLDFDFKTLDKEGKYTIPIACPLVTDKVMLEVSFSGDDLTSPGVAKCYLYRNSTAY